jgi:nucleosome binding factor SPN SPT16 subunit
MAFAVLPIYHHTVDFIYTAIKNASDSFYQDWHFVRLSFHQAIHLGIAGTVLFLKHVTSNFLSTSLAYKTSKWNGCLDITRICKPRENISSNLFKYGG